MCSVSTVKPDTFELYESYKTAVAAAIDRPLHGMTRSQLLWPLVP